MDANIMPHHRNQSIFQIFLRYCDSLTSDKVIRLLKSCRNLHTFQLRFHQEVNIAEISDAIPTSLTCLKVNGCPVCKAFQFHFYMYIKGLNI